MIESEESIQIIFILEYNQMYRPLTHWEFQEGGDLSELEGQVRIGGRETLSLGKNIPEREKGDRSMGQGQGQLEEVAPRDFACLAHLILVASAFLFSSQDPPFPHSHSICFQWG